MPDDADSFTEPDVGDPSEIDRDSRIVSDENLEVSPRDLDLKVGASDVVSTDDFVTAEDGSESDYTSAGGSFVTAAELDENYTDDALLFDGDPEDFELDLGGEIYPDAGHDPGAVLLLDEPEIPTPISPRRMSRVERRRRVRLQARRVRRIVRHLEPWSVLKISILFYACLWVIFLVAGFMIWGVAESSGTVGKLEDLITDLFALDTFDFNAGQIFRGYALGGLAMAIAGTTFNVLMCLLFNLISDLTGGLRITMIEEETARPRPPRRRRRR